MSDEPIFQPGDDLNEVIDRLLRKHRPDRFVTKGDPDEREDGLVVVRGEWLGDVADIVEAALPDGEPLRRVLRDGIDARVKSRETAGLRTTNRELRQYHRTGQWPLFDIKEPAVNGHLLDLPLGVVTRTHHRGERVKVLHEHVAFRAVHADDLRKFSIEERRRTANDSASRYEACNGAEMLADAMDEAGAVTFKDWWQRPPDEPDE